MGQRGKRASCHSWLVMYASTLDSARSGICNAAPSRVGDPRRAEDYVDSEGLT
jgi:hypothetical protein